MARLIILNHASNHSQSPPLPTREITPISSPGGAHQLELPDAQTKKLSVFKGLYNGGTVVSGVQAPHYFCWLVAWLDPDCFLLLQEV